MKLGKLIANADCKLIQGSGDIEISDIVYDSRKVIKNCLFVCLVGSNFDGHKFIEKAVEGGAAAVLVSEDINVGQIGIVKTDDTRKALALISKEYFGRPSESLVTVGITGTKIDKDSQYNT